MQRCRVAHALAGLFVLCGVFWLVVFCCCFSPPSLCSEPPCVGAQHFCVSDLSCTTLLVFPLGPCVLALLPSPPQLSLFYVTSVFLFLFRAALCPAGVLVFLSWCAVPRDSSGCHHGSCCRRGELLFPSWLPTSVACFAAVLSAHQILHVSQLNESK